MFRRLQDTLSSAASSAASAVGLSTTNDINIKSLQDMGFTESESRQALNVTNNDVNRAAELLFVQHNHSHDTTTTNNRNANTTAMTRNDDRFDNVDDDENTTLQRIMQESYEMEEQRRRGQTPTTTNNNRTAAMVKAAEAAEKRNQQSDNPIKNKKKNTNTTNKSKQPPPVTPTAITKPTINNTNNTNNISNSPLSISLKLSTLATTHPAVQLISKLQDKSKEEQIIRCVDRMKLYPTAIDAIYRVLNAIYQYQLNINKNNIVDLTSTTVDIQKYRMIDTTIPSFQKNVASVPGSIGLLKAMNYRYSGTSSTQLILDIGSIDIALLYLGVSALEQAKITIEYQQSKVLITFQKDVLNYMNLTSNSTDAAIQCSNFMSLIPSEPKNGKGAYIQVKFALPPIPISNKKENDTNDIITANNNNNRKISPKRDNNNQNDDYSNMNNNNVPILRRRFDGDDTLQDLLHWIASNIGGQICIDKLFSNHHEWLLMDLNQYPSKSLISDTLTFEQTRYQTLQYIGCWPSGKLEIRPNYNTNTENK